jgi:hypothetical protein
MIALRIHDPGNWTEASLPNRPTVESGIKVFPDYDAGDVVIEAPGMNGKPESVLVQAKDLAPLIAALSAVYERM